MIRLIAGALAIAVTAMAIVGLWALGRFVAEVAHMGDPVAFPELAYFVLGVITCVFAGVVGRCVWSIGDVLVTTWQDARDNAP